MFFWFIFAITLLLVLGLVIAYFKRSWLVAEDSVAITVDRNGFIKRVLPAGRQHLQPFERVDFTLETKTRLVAGRAAAVTTADGILVTLNWSGTYAVQPALITEAISQRLRGLVTAERTITRQADIYLRKLVGSQALQDLFNPATREQIEQQLGRFLAGRLQPLGITFNGLNLQTIDLPAEVAEAFNKARAMETLDGVIRQLDPATREVVRNAYQLEELLRWEANLPSPTRLALKRAQVTVP